MRKYKDVLKKVVRKEYKQEQIFVCTQNEAEHDVEPGDSDKKTLCCHKPRATIVVHLNFSFFVTNTFCHLLLSSAVNFYC